GKVEQVTVDMGEPVLEPKDIPVDTKKLIETDQPQTFKIAIDNTNELLMATFVSMGNPHAVIYVDDLETIDTKKLGRTLETHKAFPSRMNIHFVKINSGDDVTVIHWERGSGPTLACGTGACGVCV